MKLSIFDKKNINVPNVLSLIRLLLVPVYIVLFIDGKKYAALGIFAAASLTDLLDGYIARKYQLVTDVGKLLDPLADKLMVLTAMFSMSFGSSTIKPVIPLAAVLIVLVKEILLMIGGLVFLKFDIVVHSLMIGKVAHTVFILGLIASYFHDWFVRVCAGWFMTPDLMLIWLGVILTMIAMVTYLVVNIKQVAAKSREKEADSALSEKQ